MSKEKLISRSFELDDFFTLSEIYDKMGLETSDFEGLDEKAVQTVMSHLLVKNLHKVRNEVTSLIASLAGLSVEETKKKGIGFIIGVFTELFKDVNFTDSVNSLLPSKPIE